MDYMQGARPKRTKSQALGVRGAPRAGKTRAAAGHGAGKAAATRSARATRPSSGRSAVPSSRPAGARPRKSTGQRPGRANVTAQRYAGTVEHDGERLQKIMAAAGVASRRACEKIILEGRVQVNGETVENLGAKADPWRDEITVDLRPIQRERPIHILLNKPKGYVTTVKDTEGRPTVMALLKGISERVYPVGRLDFNSEGLMLLTNDGEMARRLSSPESGIPKVYLVKVHKMPSQEALGELKSGFRLDGVRLKPCQIEVVDRRGNPWLKVVLTEGKNQQIRKMFAAIGHPVHKLKRVQYGPLSDPDLKPGEWRLLVPAELRALGNL